MNLAPKFLGTCWRFWCGITGIFNFSRLKWINYQLSIFITKKLGSNIKQRSNSPSSQNSYILQSSKNKVETRRCVLYTCNHVTNGKIKERRMTFSHFAEVCESRERSRESIFLLYACKSFNTVYNTFYGWNTFYTDRTKSKKVRPFLHVRVKTRRPMFRFSFKSFTMDLASVASLN